MKLTIHLPIYIKKFYYYPREIYGLDFVWNSFI